MIVHRILYLNLYIYILPQFLMCNCFVLLPKVLKNAYVCVFTLFAFIAYLCKGCWLYCMAAGRFRSQTPCCWFV